MTSAEAISLMLCWSGQSTSSDLLPSQSWREQAGTARNALGANRLTQDLALTALSLLVHSSFSPQHQRSHSTAISRLPAASHCHHGSSLPGLACTLLTRSLRALRIGAADPYHRDGDREGRGEGTASLHRGDGKEGSFSEVSAMVFPTSLLLCTADG